MSSKRFRVCLGVSAETNSGGVALQEIDTKGLKFLNSSGQEVQLRGVNLGGWLVDEIWMTPWVAQSGDRKINDHVSLTALLKKRFGEAGMARVRDSWRANWITADDFRRIHDLGFNSVRLPFLCDILTEPGGLDVLRRAVAEAKAAGLYVVLDMHGVPGRQSNEHHTGQEGQNRLWFDPENITKFERDWTTIASAFRSEPAVAALDLMNEPMGAPNPAMLFLVYDRVIRAIRKVAPKKVVLVEDGYKGLETTPLPNIPGWTHVGFSLHFYDFGAKSPSDHVTSLKAQMPKLKELLWYRNAPMYAGEFNLEPFNSPEAMKSFVNVFDGADWSWALWTYKVVPPGGPMGDWGLFRAKGLVRALNAFVDSETELIQKMKQFRTENLTAPTALVGALRRG